MTFRKERKTAVQYPDKYFAHELLRVSIYLVYSSLRRQHKYICLASFTHKVIHGGLSEHEGIVKKIPLNCIFA